MEPRHRPKRHRAPTRVAAEAAEAAAEAAEAAEAAAHLKSRDGLPPLRKRVQRCTRVVPLSMHGLQLQLPLPLTIETPEGTKEGLLVSGDFDGAKLQIQIGDDVATPSKAAKLATGKSSEMNGLLLWKWSPQPGEYYSLHQLRAAGVTLESATSMEDAAEELAALASLADKKARKGRQGPKVCLEGLRLQLPLPLTIKTNEGAKEGMLISGDYDGAKLQVQVGDDVAAPSKAAKIATGKSSEVNGMLLWKWSPQPGEYYSLHQLRAGGVALDAATARNDA